MTTSLPHPAPRLSLPRTDPIPEAGLDPSAGGPPGRSRGGPPGRSAVRDFAALALGAGTGEDIAVLTTPAQASRWRWSPRTLGAFAIALLGGLLILGVLAWLGRGGGAASASPAAVPPRSSVAGPVSSTEGPAVVSSGPPATPGASQGEAARGESGPATPTAGESSPTTIVAYISGEVATPGVYSAPGGARVNDLVELAGGLTPNADGAAINLAEPVTDGSHIHIPAPGEAPRALSGSGGSTNPGGSGGSKGGKNGGAGGGGSGAAGGGSGKSNPGALINLNTASASDLETLPGVGPATALDILTWRESNGPFTSPEDLLEVPGIGPAKFTKLSALVTV
ncbi:helix-hairpin-helix domain-containing protein [Actinotignum sp. GS-2025a]|uniref:helix-hairpin-helix domain-containing protein n=1 Tax=Actinotignum sp. GS-2025a TaxID=3427274 RepID=UPI003F448A27